MPSIVCDNDKKVFGTKEWASCTFNNIVGCPHDCLYCYSKSMAIRFKRRQSEDWHIAEPTMSVFTKKKIFDGRVMYPSSHDITPKTFAYSIKAIESILRSGNRILIVSKPHYECVVGLCEIFEDFKDAILFRFTIGSIKNETLKFWEPGAPTFEERFESLKHSSWKGFATSISVEPILDDTTSKLIEKLKEYVSDSIWLGEANFLIQRLRQNGQYSENSKMAAEALLKLYDSDYLEALYERYKADPIIRWKDSLKKRFGIALNDDIGIDL